MSFTLQGISENNAIVYTILHTQNYCSNTQIPIHKRVVFITIKKGLVPLKVYIFPPKWIFNTVGVG